jgi:hypothetical protein
LSDERSIQIAVTVRGQDDQDQALEQAKAVLDQFHPKVQVGDTVLVRHDLPHAFGFGDAWLFTFTYHELPSGDA